MNANASMYNKDMILQSERVPLLNSQKEEEKKSNKSKPKRERVSVEYFFSLYLPYKDVTVYLNFPVHGYYPEVKKYMRTFTSQEFFEPPRLKIGYTVLRANPYPVIFYVPYNITFRMFLEDIGLDTSYNYYVGKYIITQRDMDLTFEVLSTAGPLRNNAIFEWSRWKYPWLTEDWSDMSPESIRPDLINAN